MHTLLFNTDRKSYTGNPEAPTDLTFSDTVRFSLSSFRFETQYIAARVKS